MTGRPHATEWGRVAGKLGGLPTMNIQGIGIYRELKEMRGILILNARISIKKATVIGA